MFTLKDPKYFGDKSNKAAVMVGLSCQSDGVAKVTEKHGYIMS